MTNNANLHRLWNARVMQHFGGPGVSYVDLRILEKKKLVVLYRNPDGSILTPILTDRGYDALGLNPYGAPFPLPDTP